jgi:hypothetical protein
MVVRPSPVPLPDPANAWSNVATADRDEPKKS